MIPTIGIIIGLYVLVRMSELLATSKDRYSSGQAMLAIKLHAGITLMIVAVLTLNLIMAGTTAKSILPDSGLPSLSTSPTGDTLTPDQMRERDARIAAQMEEMRKQGAKK